MVADVRTSSTVIGPSARSESRCAIFAAVASSSSGSGLKMPPADLPVTIAHVANVTRSDGVTRRHVGAERVGDRLLVQRPPRARQPGSGRSPLSRACGIVRRRRWRGCSASPARPASGAAPTRLHRRAVTADSACSSAISSAVFVFWYSCSCSHLVAVLDRVLDQLLDRVEVRVAHGLQLDRRQVEVVLDAVLDPHRHQRVQAQLDQRHLPRAGPRARSPSRCATIVRQALPDGLAGVRRPLGEIGAQVRTLDQAVVQDLGIGLFGGVSDAGASVTRMRRDGRSDGRPPRVAPSTPTRPGHDRVVHQREGLVDAGVHLHRRPAGVPRQRRHQPGAVARHRTLLGRGQLTHPEAPAPQRLSPTRPGRSRRAACTPRRGGRRAVATWLPGMTTDASPEKCASSQCSLRLNRVGGMFA